MTAAGAVMRAGALLVAAALLAPLAAPAGTTSPLPPLSAFPRERIAVETRGARRHLFEAWRADTPDTRAQGLMFVKSLRPEQAMIFVYEPAQHVGMWMKNTLIPLDMIFIRADGRIARIAENTEPMSRRIVSSVTLKARARSET